MINYLKPIKKCLQIDMEKLKEKYDNQWASIKNEKQTRKKL